MKIGKGKRLSRGKICKNKAEHMYKAMKRNRLPQNCEFTGIHMI